MNKVTELMNAIKERKIITEKIDLLRKEICNEFSPYKIGHIVKVKGYSHEGKKCRVTDTYFSIDESDARLGVMAVVLKDDGSDSKYTTKWHDWNDPALKKALENILLQYEFPARK